MVTKEQNKISIVRVNKTYNNSQSTSSTMTIYNEMSL